MLSGHWEQKISVNSDHHISVISSLSQNFLDTILFHQLSVCMKLSIFTAAAALTCSQSIRHGRVKWRGEAASYFSEVQPRLLCEFNKAEAEMVGQIKAWCRGREDRDEVCEGNNSITCLIVAGNFGDLWWIWWTLILNLRIEQTDINKCRKTSYTYYLYL